MEKKEIREYKGYKVFNPDWTCRGFQFEVGKTYEEDVVPKCRGKGFHFCLKAVDCFNCYDFKPTNKVAEVVALGEVDYQTADSKCCTNKIKIIREIPWDELLKIVNTGNYNKGYSNTGHYNTGNKNTGSYNTGDYNTSECNTGNRNTGDYNTGYYNTGSYNTGNRNTGDRNLGDCNTGSWNKSSFNTGFFMTEEQNIMLFNKLSDLTYKDFTESDAYRLLLSMPEEALEWIDLEKMTEEEKSKNPTHKTTNRYEGKSYTAELFEQIYDKVEKSSDTIFNCWSFFRMFKTARIGLSKMYLLENTYPYFENCGGLKELFQGYEDIWKLLDEFADLHHCLANMMPAPRGYNGTKNRDGKGKYDRDNDMPDIYYQRAEKDFPKMHCWINDHMDTYCLSFFKEYHSPWIDGKANGSINLKDNKSIESYKKAINDAISCIKNRAEQLYELKSKRS